MEVYTTNIEEVVFREIRNCQKSIVIISPYLSNYTVRKLVEICKNNALEVIVVTRFEHKAFIEGASSLEAISLLLKNEIPVLALKNLHSKLYVLDNSICLVGSANFTKKAFAFNNEIILKLSDLNETQQLINYSSNMINYLFEEEWLITSERLNIERQYLENNKTNTVNEKDISFSWGAEIIPQKQDHSGEIVLSLTVGGTSALVEKYSIHAHPNNKNYSYKRLNELITFRGVNGVMNRIYKIDFSLILDPLDWYVELKTMNIPSSIKYQIENYIIERKTGFTFEKTGKYKFYILTGVTDLPHEPMPISNNRKHLYFIYDDLISGRKLIKRT